MKKIFLFLSIFLILGVIVNSCISEKVDEIEQEPDPGPDPDPGPGPGPGPATKKTFYLRFLPSETMDSTSIKTYAGPSLESVNPSLYWGDAESTGVFMIGSDNTSMYSNRKYEFSFSSSVYVDTITTTFETAAVFGYTPYQSSISGMTVSYILDNVQDQSADNSTEYYMDESLEKNVFTIAPISNSLNLNGGVCPMTYKSIFAFLRIQVTKSSSLSFFNLQKIKHVKLYIADENDLEKPLNYNLAGGYNIDVSKAPDASGYTGPVFLSGVNNIMASVTGGDHISEYITNSPYVWFVINPITIKSTERLVAVIETGMGTEIDYWIISQHVMPALKPNAIYTLDVKADVDNTMSDKYIATYFFDDQASNCYIVPQAGMCRIPLKTVRGADLRGHSVDWLWVSKEGGDNIFDINELIDTSSIVYNESAEEVKFRVGTKMGKYTKGNVVLALKDDQGKIVWTWHIWITDDLQDVKYEGDKYFLDRNVGALLADMASPGIDNYGFVYQWGRKDPFFGGDGDSDEATVLSIAKNSTKVNNNVSGWSLHNGVATADVATKNPMMFISNNSSSKSEPADWLSSTDQNRWRDDIKTDNDPCPYGYRVPSNDDLMVLHETPQTSLWYFQNAGFKYWNYYYYGGAITAWPAAGMRLGRSSADGYSGGQLIHSGTDAKKGQCIYWSSSPANIEGTMIPGASHRIYTVGNKLYEFEYGDNADAYPVRCVKMETP